MADHQRKADVPCLCGDEAHNNLEEWYEEYQYFSNDSLQLSGDKFDRNAIEQRIQQLLPQAPVCNGYCLSCRKLLDQWPEIVTKVPEDTSPKRGPYRQLYYKSTLELEAGHRNGCLLCTLFLQCFFDGFSALENWYRVENRLNCLGRSTRIFVVVFNARSIHLALTWPDLSHRPYCATDFIHCIQNNNQNYQQQFMDCDRALSAAADKNVSQLELAKKWLDSCLEKHDCCKPAKDTRLPTRLVDLDSKPIRLVCSSDLPKGSRYATLSHCWGTQTFYVLQQDNLKELLKAIPEEKLTKTFQDAIYITRALGIQYLWIDSLCIIQGCDRDWSTEAALMSSVYGGSAITIAATGAEDGTKGCFLKPSGLVDKVHFKSKTGEVWDIAPARSYRSINLSPLAGRAWALQERLLSTRVLHFTETGLFWECRHCDASEAFPNGLPNFEQYHRFHRSRKPLTENWHVIVRLYTGARLTIPSDKLIAISGIAQKAFEENEDQYLAGLWRNDIEFQLLWSLRSFGDRSPRGSRYRAPSWSWASIDARHGHASYDPREEASDYIHYAHVLDASVVPPGVDASGRLEGGKLLMSYSFMLASDFLKTSCTMSRGMAVSYSNVTVFAVDGREGCLYAYPDSEDYEGHEVYLLPILTRSIKCGYYSDRRDLKGLMILPTGNRKGEFHRVGTFTRHGYSKNLASTFLESFSDNTAEEQCAEILEEPRYENERYVLTLV